MMSRALLLQHPSLDPLTPADTPILLITPISLLAPTPLVALASLVPALIPSGHLNLTSLAVTVGLSMQWDDVFTSNI